jgi:hypothetical protein
VLVDGCEVGAVGRLDREGSGEVVGVLDGIGVMVGVCVGTGEGLEVGNGETEGRGEIEGEELGDTVVEGLSLGAMVTVGELVESVDGIGVLDGKLEGWNVSGSRIVGTKLVSLTPAKESSSTTITGRLGSVVVLDVVVVVVVSSSRLLVRVWDCTCSGGTVPTVSSSNKRSTGRTNSTMRVGTLTMQCIIRRFSRSEERCSRVRVIV